MTRIVSIPDTRYPCSVPLVGRNEDSVRPLSVGGFFLSRSLRRGSPVAETGTYSHGTSRRHDDRRETPPHTQGRDTHFTYSLDCTIYNNTTTQLQVVVRSTTARSSGAR